MVTESIEKSEISNIFYNVPDEDTGNEDECRVCQGVSENAGPLISPCYCKGTVGMVHISCLQRWLQSSCRLYCEICNFRFQMICCRQQTFCESVQSWLRHPLRKQRFKTDVLSLCLLTIILALVTAICVMKIERAYKAESLGYDPTWTVTLMTLFMTVMCVCYGWAFTYLILRQAVPWYRFWKTTRRVQLELFDMSSPRKIDPSPAVTPRIITEPIQIALQ